MTDSTSADHVAVEADALVLDEGLSMWGGLDPATGRIIDTHHPQLGASTAGRVLVFPGTRGSTSSASTLAEALRAGCGPAALVVSGPDQALVVATLAVRELYGLDVPYIVADAESYGAMRTGDRVRVSSEGQLSVIEQR